MRAFFVSDLHLKAEDTQKAQIFLSFLNNLPEDATHLILLGDIFDLWVGNHEYFQKKFPKLIENIKSIVSRKVEVHYFEGNHDLHLKKFWEDHLGVTVHNSYKIFQWGDLIVRAEHGDLMNPEDKGYLFLRKFLRTKPMEFISYHLPGSIVGFIGDRSSRMSRIYSDRLNQKYKEAVQSLTRNYAQKIYKETPFDLFVSGHTHVDDDFTFDVDGKKARSVNLGSWLDKPKYLIVIQDTSTIQYL